MTATTFETARSDGGWATWLVIGAMGCAALALTILQADAPARVAPQIAMSAQDCAACHAGPNVLAAATMGHTEIGLDLVLVPGMQGSEAVHSRQDCASCHTLR